MSNTKTETETKHGTDTVMPVLAGLVLGGLAGAGAGLLLAPQSGKETRQQIQQKAIELRDLTSLSVDEAVAQAKSKTQELTAEVREKAADLEQHGRELVAKQLGHVSEAAEAGKAAVSGSKSR